MPRETESAYRRTLNGWKEIAAYLGKSVRSVQRWEATLGLPVHRIKTPDGQIVYAEADEINTWRQALDVSPVREPEQRSDRQSDPRLQPEAIASAPAIDPWTHRLFRHRQGWLIAATVLIVIAGVAGTRQVTSQPPVPVDFRLGGRTLDALSPDGTVLWTHRFDRDVSEIPTRGPRLSFQFMDIDGDNETEIVVFVRFAQKGRPATISDGVFCFGRAGQLHWSVIPDRTLTFGNERYGPPWVIEDFVASDTPGPRRLWIAVSHATWWPSFVLEISSRGAVHVRYVQAGRIFSLAHWITSAGGVLAVGGVLQEPSEATLALLQDADPAASFPSPGSGLYECLNCPRVNPRKMFAFANSADARLFPELHPLVRNINVSGSDLKVNLDTGIRPPGMHAVVMVGPDQVPRSVRLTDAYWRVHRELEQTQQIDHTADQCPDRDGLIVREWTSAGWRELQVEAEASPHQTTNGSTVPGTSSSK